MNRPFIFSTHFFRCLLKAVGDAFLVTIIVGIFLLLVSCGPDKNVVAAKGAFLESTPQLKLVYERMIVEQHAYEDNVSNLKKLKRSFNQPSAKSAVQSKIDDLNSKLSALNSQIDKIEEEVEKGVALRQFNQMDGGGLRDNDVTNLMNESLAVLDSTRNDRNLTEKTLDQPSLDRTPTPSPKPLIPYRLGLSSSTNPPESVIPVAVPVVEPEIKTSTNANDLDQFRIWTSKNGKSINARLLDLTESGQIVLGDQFGASIVGNINALIEEDQLLIRNYAKQGFHEHDHEGVDGRLSYRVMNTTDGYLNVRGGPGLKFKTKGKIMASARGVRQTGKIIHVKSEDIYWMPIRFGEIEGFVSAGFLQPE